MTKKTATKYFLCTLTCMTLGAMSTAAYSQSIEYRRGYEQGFRDGAASVQSGQGRYSGQHGRPIINEATYGTRNRSCDARQTVQQLADNSQAPHYDIRVDNQLCGDPARDQVKSLSLRYRCGNGPEQRVTVREGDSIPFNCQ